MTSELFVDPSEKITISFPRSQCKPHGTARLLFKAAAAAKSLQSCPTLCDPRDGSPPGSSVHGDSPGKNTGVGCHALLQGHLPNSGIEPRFPALQVDSLLSEPPGKPPSHFKPMLFTNQKH